jgi:hypothetical protein
VALGVGESDGVCVLADVELGIGVAVSISVHVGRGVLVDLRVGVRALVFVGIGANVKMGVIISVGGFATDGMQETRKVAMKINNIVFDFILTSIFKKAA